MPAHKGAHAIFPIRLRPEEKEKLRALSAEKKLSMSDVARDLITREHARVLESPQRTAN